jgi:mRNA interferase RelE/StbE
LDAYEVEVRPAVRKALRKMHPQARAAILTILHNLGVEPRPPGVTSLKGHRPYLRLRIGDYRIIYAVDDDAGKVTAPWLDTAATSTGQSPDGI